jgi:hypothetical protein
MDCANLFVELAQRMELWSDGLFREWQVVMDQHKDIQQPEPQGEERPLRPGGSIEGLI